MSQAPAYQEYEHQNWKGQEETRLRIFIEHLDEGLSYAQKKGFKDITLATQKPGRIKQTIDLSFLKNFKEATSLNIGFLLSQKTDISPIYELTLLEELITIKGFSIDTSYFPRLKHLHAQQLVDEIKNLDDLKGVTQLLFYPKSHNLSYLKPIKSLEYIKILQTQIESLDGIERLPNLKQLIIRGAPRLLNIDRLSDSNSVEYFLLESANRLIDYSSLAGNSSIQNLSIGSVKSVAFIPHMKAIKEFSADNILDGNLLPLMESKTLEWVGLYPQRRHYSHQETEINTVLEQSH